jgi:hypothetical protein
MIVVGLNFDVEAGPPAIRLGNQAHEIGFFPNEVSIYDPETRVNVQLVYEHGSILLIADLAPTPTANYDPVPVEAAS